jgi:AraC-like DNA-binding protein
MPLYMDRHNVPGLTSKDAAMAHLKDLEIQDEYGCNCINYWVDEERGNVFCLIDSPSKQVLKEMHNRAHGLIPSDIIEVDSNLVKAFLGQIHDQVSLDLNSTPFPVNNNDSGFRYLLVVDLKDRLFFECLYGKPVATELIKSFNLLIHQSIQHYFGRIVESNEEFIVSFISVDNAVDCALHLRNSILFQNTCINLPKVNIKTGLCEGFPVSGHTSLYGEAIKKAKLLSFISEDNKIYLTSAIKDQYKGNSPQVFNSSRTVRAINSDESNFLVMLMDLFHNSILTNEIDMKKLCYQLGVSTSKLYRNSINITGLSPNELLKEIRLVAAIQLMRKQNKNISETSFELCFTNPSYFTKCFKKRFNLVPADFIKSMNPVLA